MVRFMAAGYGNDIEEKGHGVLDPFIGNYVEIYFNNNSFAGRLIGIEDGSGILNPHMACRYNKDGKRTFSLVDEASLVRITDRVGIIPTTRESLEGNCVSRNKHEEENDKKKD